MSSNNPDFFLILVISKLICKKYDTLFYFYYKKIYNLIISFISYAPHIKDSFFFTIQNYSYNFRENEISKFFQQKLRKYLYDFKEFFTEFILAHIYFWLFNLVHWIGKVKFYIPSNFCKWRTVTLRTTVSNIKS